MHQIFIYGYPSAKRLLSLHHENVSQIQDVEKDVTAALASVKEAGIPAAVIKKRGQLTVWERIEYLVDPGTWCPLHTLYNPQANVEGTTGVIDGLAKINGKWAVVIGFDNKVIAGAYTADLAPDDIACLQYTGGTTGLPKIAKHKFEGMAYQGWLASTLIFDETDAVEINRVILDNLHRMSEYNFDMQHRPRINIVYDDGISRAFVFASVAWGLIGLLVGLTPMGFGFTYRTPTVRSV